MKRKQYRRKYLVHGKYQLSQAAVMIISNLSVALLMAALLSWFYLLVWSGHGSVVYNHNRMIPVYLTCAIFMVSLLSIFWSLRRSRAIAGMIKKIDGVLIEASHGIFPDKPLAFRKGDHFTSLAVSINRCLRQLKNKDLCPSDVIPSIKGLAKRIESGGISNKEIRNNLNNIITKLEES